METWMVLTAVAVVGLPFALMLAFQGRDLVDARGRRARSDWRVDRQKI